MPGPGRGCLLRGVPASGGGVPAPRVAWRTPEMATAVGGTHPTGMHSCFTNILPKTA